MTWAPAALAVSNGVAGWPQLAQQLVGAGNGIDTVADCFRTYPFNISLSAAETAGVLSDAGHKITTEWPDTLTSYFIVPAAGLANPASRILSVKPDNSLGFVDKDDGSGRQLWRFTKLTEGVYAVSNNQSKGLLSCHPEQSHPVDLSPTDDNLGHQHWTLTPTGDSSFTITIETRSALQNYAYKYLSCDQAGSAVDLWWQDGAGGRQQWRLLPWPAADGTEYVIQTEGQESGPGTYLAPTQDRTHLEFSKDPCSWTFQMVAKGVYRIKAAATQTYLSCRWDSKGSGQGSEANAYYGDDGSGRQRWTLTPQSGGSFTMTIDPPDALQSPDFRYLSCGSDGTYFDLWSQDDGKGRQRWRVSRRTG